MSSTVDAVRRIAARSPARRAVRWRTGALTYADLLRHALAIARALEARRIEVAALLADNSPNWIALDLGAQIAGTVLVPLPPYFTRTQIAHALADSGADAMLADPRLPAARTLDVCALEPLAVTDSELAWCRLPANLPAEMPAATAKISYTSGTTGTPKGVCLAQPGMDAVADSLRGAVAELDLETHLCVLPLATLLENIAGVYAPLRNGGEIVVAGARETGLFGSARFDTAALLRCIDAYRPDSMILVPQLLAALVAELERGAERPASLELVAVGGGRVSPALLARADRLGLPVYEGYGLTECGSVVALNTPRARRIGSVGKPLAHAEVTIDGRGEIHIASSSLGGYVGGHRVPQRFATGDLGRLDDDGFLYVSGRRKNLFITSFGRNVSPEWVEGELCDEAAIAQAAVFGEARPWNAAVIVPAPTATREQLCAAIAAANRRLPDYARVQSWLVAKEPFTPANGELTANGRNRRSVISARYRCELDALYDATLDLTG
jgi:long-subunit acyl-CoA synthetase (AMP-forming)